MRSNAGAISHNDHVNTSHHSYVADGYIVYRVSQININRKRKMFRALASSSPLELRKWGAYALVLLVPGSFVVLPVFLLVRHLASLPRAGKEN